MKAGVETSAFTESRRSGSVCRCLPVTVQNRLRPQSRVRNVSDHRAGLGVSLLVLAQGRFWNVHETVGTFTGPELPLLDESVDLWSFDAKENRDLGHSEKSIGHDISVCTQRERLTHGSGASSHPFVRRMMSLAQATASATLSITSRPSAASA
jgi:hypothetical protein